MIIMELLLEVIMYLLVVLGIITVCCTFFSKVNILDTMAMNDKWNERGLKKEYARNKKEGEKVILVVKYKNICGDEMQDIKIALENGTYSSIFDVVDTVKYVDLNKKSKK